MKMPKITSQMEPNLRYFRHFANCNFFQSLLFSESGKGETYRQKQIDHIHQHQYNIPHSRLMIPVRAEHEQASNNVVREHLGVVSTSLLDMNYDDLLEPEAELDEVVPF